MIKLILIPGLQPDLQTYILLLNYLKAAVVSKAAAV